MSENYTRPSWATWVDIELSDTQLAELREVGAPLKGDVVKATSQLWVGNGLDDQIQEGTTALVVGWGRGERSHQLFTEREALAVAQNRELNADDYEVLIDAEGPVVIWPDGTVDWFPGQSMGAIRTVDSWANLAQ